MLLTFFLSVVVCGAVSLMMISGIAFIQDIKMFSSAPKEARDVLIPRDRPSGMVSEADLHSGSFS